MYNNYKVGAIIQARMTSSRLPGKVLLPLFDKPVLQHIIERLRRSKYIDDVIVACTTNEADQPIIDLCDKLECKYFRGSEDDVLSRVSEAAKLYDTDIIVEITADCPCVYWDLVDMLIERLDEEKDYVSNVMNRTLPRGLDVQVFWTKTLERVAEEIDNDVDRQHVSTWIYKNPKNYGKYRTENFALSDVDYSNLRLTLDTEEDYALLKFMYEAFEGNVFSIGDILNLFKVYPELPLINSHVPQKSYYKELSEWQNTPH
jgi:spore coat polysaccharide biosynthesis protein SpsF